MKRPRLSLKTVLPCCVVVVLLGATAPLMYCRRPSAAPPPPAKPEQGKKFVKMVGRILTRSFPVGEVLYVSLGLEKERLLSLPESLDLEHFRKWLAQTDKKVVTVSRLRVPNLRPERPVLDGQDIYEGFFAPTPPFWDLSAPLEGSVSMLKRQGFTFTEAELKALDAMMRRSLGHEENGRFAWYPLPVGSRTVIISGKAPLIEVWVNEGPQLPSVDETIAQARCVKKSSVKVTDPLEIEALNKHYNYSMIAEDDDVKKNTNGKFSRVCDRLYDVITKKRYNPDESL